MVSPLWQAVKIGRKFLTSKKGYTKRKLRNVILNKAMFISLLNI